MGKIVWLASYPKSGNTWLRAFLHNFLRNPDEAYDLNRMDEYSLGDSGGIFYQKFLRKPRRFVNVTASNAKIPVHNRRIVKHENFFSGRCAVLVQHVNFILD